MNYLKKHFSLYAHLPREIYVLAFGKIMTSMGALIWPMMTLIMSEKLGMNGQTIGLYTMLLSLFMGPFYLLGGKLADKYNKKTIIVTFDLIGNSLYLVCAMLPLSMNTLYLLAIASVFQSMEQPAYDALIADPDWKQPVSGLRHAAPVHEHPVPAGHCLGVSVHGAAGL